MADVKNTEEIIDLGLVVANGLVKAKTNDGKIDMKELLGVGVEAFDELLVAVEGVTKVKGEIQDIDLEEAKRLLFKTVDLVKALSALVTAGPKA